jgi:hypothetical protein
VRPDLNKLLEESSPMLKNQLARMLGSLAVATFLIALMACGGSSSKPLTTTAPPPATGPNKAQVLLFPALTSTDPNFGDFMANILPNVSGVSVSMKWSDIETSQGNYDFTAFDATLQPYENAGAQVNLIVWPATEGGNNDPATSGSTPAYIFTASYAASVGAPNPQDMAVCGDYNGDSSNPFYALSSAGTGGGFWNVSSAVTNASDISGLPVSYELPFMTAYQKFIAQVITHYNNSASPKIGYIRFGFSQGGEDSPECNPFWPGYSETAYVNYVQTMTNFVAAQNPTRMTILADLHAVGDPPVLSYADQEASFAVADKMGIGTNGLQQSDISASANSTACDSDWCALFAQYGSTTYSGTKITLSLQTLQWSDPTGVAQTGSLATIGSTQGLIPFVQSKGVNNLELYLADAALAFSPNYCNYPHAQCGAGGAPNYNQPQYVSAYKSAIQSYISGQ